VVNELETVRELHCQWGLRMGMDWQGNAATVAKGARETLRLDPPATEQLRMHLRGARAEATVGEGWVLEGRLGDDGGPQRTPIRPVPFRIGRSARLELSLPSLHVSKRHAEIYSDGEALRVRDLGSRNGTFVNHEPVSDSALHDGDLLHFGDFEFRLVRAPAERPESLETTHTLVRVGPPPGTCTGGGREMRELLQKGAVTMALQPIVHLPSLRVAAYEALGRGRHPGLPEGPVALFEIAGQLGPDTQAELSRTFRRRAVELVRDRPEPPVLFLNTHPAELERPGLLESLEELRTFAPNVDLVLEIHESALAQTDFITWLRAKLSEINVGLAYDDFGAGQARLFELAEAPPHYLKFDRRFVTGLDHAPTSRQRLVASLVAAARELLVKTVAEGVETAEEAKACLRAGFSHAQGYHFGRPVPVDGIA
jgi:EAL domain-containing protein (putative c-di-GMP-specific phosphodiesterase class I)